MNTELEVKALKAVKDRLIDEWRKEIRNGKYSIPITLVQIDMILGVLASLSGGPRRPIEIVADARRERDELRRQLHRRVR